MEVKELVSSYWLWVSLGVGLCFHTVLKLLVLLWWRPRRLEQDFATQAIKGPPYRFFHGNVREMVGLMIEASSKPMPAASPFSHDILPRVLSFYPHWKKIYGSTFLLWFGPTARIVVDESDLIREIFFSNSDSYDKYESHPLVRQLEGDGLLSLSGAKWAHHRKVVSKTFNSENLKVLIPSMAKSVVEMLERWPTSTSDEVEIDVSEWFQSVTEDVITRAAFGESYVDGKAVFRLQAKQMMFAAEAFQNVLIPGYRFLPTKKNVDSWKVDREIKGSLLRLIQSRKEKMVNDREEYPCGRGDLVGHLIDASLKESGPAETPVLTVDDMVEECKTFFFAGKHTTSNLLTWATVLLAMHPEWQHKARQEVLQVCGRRHHNSNSRADVVPTRDHVTKFKTLKMILNETLRLYPPVIATIRRAKSDVELGGRYKIPKGTELMIPIIALHHDPDLWGPDVHEFNPARFEEITGSWQHGRFMPFGIGPRTCVGQNLALLEAKLTLAIILQRFSFRLSPSYVQAPTVLMLLYPQFGAPVIFTRLPCD